MADEPTADRAPANDADADGPGVAVEQVLAAAAGLRDFHRPWWVAGGWAIDLFVGRVNRPHADLELGIWRDDQAALRSFWPGRAWHQAVEGTWLPWAGERVELPVFQLRATDQDAGREVEIFLNDRAADGTFVCRRDDRLRLPADRLVLRSPYGLPVLAPEVQLLYKAKYARPKDEQDLAQAMPAMTAGQRRWLADALGLLHPGHTWLARLHTARPPGPPAAG